ncbi:MAG TPA: adenylate/guanylate cyclase domain-containing protein [Gaiella sp.]|nr:adenylate/guanylate cyclase domain-containing protein [Gaiella sp.]
MGVAVVSLLLPVVGFVLLLAVPSADAHWQHGPSHFWLILATALVNVVLGLAASEAARRRSDARAFLVSLAFLVSAGFLALHALATPGSLVEGRNVGFVIATPIGLVLASGFAAVSSLSLSPRAATWIVEHEGALRTAVLAALALWAVVSVAELSPLDGPPPEGELHGPLIALAAPGIALFGYAAWRYLELYRRRRDPLPAALAAAWVLLAEALLAIGLSRSWHLSWWEWHLLMACAFALVAWTARASYRSSASVAGAFGGLYLDGTLERLDTRTGDALRALVGALETGDSVDKVADELRDQGLSSDEVAVLERSAREVRRIETLFRPYVSPELAVGLEEAPELARLGGEEREVTVLFADLEGFTRFAERCAPGESIEMLNSYWAAAVPGLLGEGATIERFAGDAVMAVFNAMGDQRDHADRGVRAARALLEASEALSAQNPGWPRFRVGVATGPAAVGHVGTADQRSFAAIGDTTNLAARLQAAARPGEALVAESTAGRRRDPGGLEPRGRFEVRGRDQPVEVYGLAQGHRPPRA